MEGDSQNSSIVYEVRLKWLKSMLADKQQQLNEALSQLNEAVSENENLKALLKQRIPSNDNYNLNRTWVSKIVFIVKNAEKPLRSAEIIDVLHKKEPLLQEKVSKEKFISPSLNAAVKYKRLIPFKLKGVRGNFYCLPEWIDENMELLPEMRKKIY